MKQSRGERRELAGPERLFSGGLTNREGDNKSKWHW
jgi:hypothetical protein